MKTWRPFQMMSSSLAMRGGRDLLAVPQLHDACISMQLVSSLRGRAGSAVGRVCGSDRTLWHVVHCCTVCALHPLEYGCCAFFLHHPSYFCLVTCPNSWVKSRLPGRNVCLAPCTTSYSFSHWFSLLSFLLHYQVDAGALVPHL